VRLVTLTGPGGVGKTHLALEAVHDFAPDFAGGVYFVSLSAIREPDFVLPAIAQVLGLHETGARPLLEHLQAALGEQSLLLLLDNFEQVLPAAPSLAELLATCPRLKLLVTSRASLRLSGECELAVLPLALPDLARLPAPESLSQFAACALFIARATAITPSFAVTPETVRPIAEICLRLDGLPLAIELAAARSRLLTPLALLARLAQPLSVLTSGTRNAPARQQTMRATIAWSYQLLAPEVRQLFRFLSVFAGGCTLAAIEALASPAGLEADTVLDGVSTLVEHSLLRQVEQPGNEGRLLLLETVREYGQECLEHAGEREAAQAAHAAYYLALAEEAEPHLRGAEQTNFMARLEHDQENLRAALRFLLEQTDLGTEGLQAELALRLCVALHWFWHVRGSLREGQVFLEQALTGREGLAPLLQARALYAAAELAAGLDEMERSETFCGECLSLSREINDTAGIASSLDLLGSMARVRGQYALAGSRLEEAAELFGQMGDRWMQGRCHVEIARMATEQGEYERAGVLLEDHLRFCQQSGDQVGVHWVQYLLARTLFVQQEELERAELLAEQSLMFFQQRGYAWYRAYPLNLLAQMRLAQGELALVREWLEESLGLVQEVGDREGAVEVVLNLARVAVVLGEQAPARRRYQEALTLLHEMGSQQFLAACLEGLAAAVVAQAADQEPSAQIYWAVLLWGAAAGLREAMSTPLPPAHRPADEQARATAHRRLGDHRFAAAWAEGRAMTWEQAVAAEGKPRPPTAATPHAAAAARLPSRPSPFGLTPRELDVLRLLAQGLSDAQIAEQLVIARRTVNWYLTSIYSKLGVSSRVAATRAALEQHLL
jgi:predicted ATPase/DNA-binding CsgD family transcriptional regulator